MQSGAELILFSPSSNVLHVQVATQNLNFIQIDAVAEENRLLWITGTPNLLINSKHFIAASETARTWTRSSSVREVNV